MTLGKYLLLVAFGTMLCALAWLFLLFGINPEKAGLVGKFFFYLTLFFTLIGANSLLGFIFCKIRVHQDEIVFRHAKRTYRQSLILASFIILALILLAEKLLAWWNGIILIAIFIMIETVIFSGRKHNNVDYVK